MFQCLNSYMLVITDSCLITFFWLLYYLLLEKMVCPICYVYSSLCMSFPVHCCPASRKWTPGDCLCDNSKPSFLPHLLFSLRTFSKRVTAGWSRGWAKYQPLTNQNSRYRWCQIARWTTGLIQHWTKRSKIVRWCCARLINRYPDIFNTAGFPAKVYLYALDQHCASNFLVQCCLRHIWQHWLDNIPI